MKPIPYPADTQAKGWRFELDYEAINQSDTWDLAKPEAKPWLLMMWLVAWQQKPCGSLPSDDELLIAKIGIPEKLWAKHKSVLLRGWWAAEDGRLYHDTLVKRVGEMLETKTKERKRKAEYRRRMAAEAIGSPASVPRDKGGKDVTGTGTISNTPLPPKGAPTVPCPIEEIIGMYHEILPELPSAKLRLARRDKAIRSFWAWIFSSKKSDGTPRARDGDEALAWVRGYFERARQNDWLMGRTERYGEHANWQCDIDFLLTDRGKKHVIEKTREAA